MSLSNFQGTLDIYHASAGTGKTSKLLDIIESYLDQGVPIERIAFVTFTRKGAEVAQDRIARRFNLPMNRLKNIRTIHSMCFRACNANKEMMMDYKKYQEFGGQVGYDFGRLGLDITEGVNWNELKDQRLVSAEQLYRTNRDYCERIIEDRVDFNDLIRYMRLYTKFKNTFGYCDFTDLLERYIAGECYEDVDIACLDEMQDSSPLQWRVMFQAFARASHIYAVGDCKQAIFTYAGAAPSILLKLRGRPHFLDTSFRVPSRILSFANNIAQEINEQVAMDCKPAIDGGEVHELTCIDELTEHFVPNESWFFLARNKKFFKYYQQWCIKHGIPYKLKGIPYFSDTEKVEFREGRTQYWDPDKLDFATRCYKLGTFYNGPSVNITTIHTVKGDEADNVVVLSDISKAVEVQFDIDPDSEHRVFYVATTRAKKRLFVVQPQTRMFYPYLLT